MGESYLNRKAPIVRKRSVETALADEREARLRAAAAQALGDWLEHSPNGWKRPIGALQAWEIRAMADAAVSAWIVAASNERDGSGAISEEILWLFSG